MDVQVENLSEPNSPRRTQKSIYAAGPIEIFWKNFLAGMSQALGALLIYVIATIISYILFVKYALPALQPLISTYTKSVETLGQFKQATGSPGASSDMQFQLPNIDQKTLDAAIKQLQPVAAPKKK